MSELENKGAENLTEVQETAKEKKKREKAEAKEKKAQQKREAIMAGGTQKKKKKKIGWIIALVLVVVIVGYSVAVSYTHLRAHETRHDLVCRLLLEKKKKKNP